MASNELRKKVLSTFKLLHKARLLCFKNDFQMLNAAKHQINEEFKKNKTVSDPAVVQNLITFAQDVEHELLTQVVQAERVNETKFKLNLDPERHTMENIPYVELDNETYEKWKEEKKKKSKKNEKCCCD
ncbi:PREDICTED: complex III assembly factor LYRM7 [Diuraphis noxia]|uniref:complex III assembly factor LYRM7 n=1 Tax=Diuraphis noxia TaxID=143948 RepID=UPI0007639F9A|nr:PREDICTED: complex III assembly factor LYRM7 [Diuraphis noxia]